MSSHSQPAPDSGPDQITSASGRTWPANRYRGEHYAIGQRVCHRTRGGAVVLGRDDWDTDTSYVRFDGGEESPHHPRPTVHHPARRHSYQHVRRDSTVTDSTASHWPKSITPPSGIGDPFTADIVARCLWARAHNDGHPKLAWSTGEQLAVALVLDDHQHLAGMDYSVEEATRRVHDGMSDPPADTTTWLGRVRHLVEERS